ncbi:MAG: SH3 domain-containing protein, partial [Clostridia bacterium]|nr:SH3 domain-containing protein [Clostridia bacterium]
VPHIPTATPVVSGNRYARVTTAKGSLNLRNAPSSTARVLRTIPQYETVQVYQDDGKWCYVNYSGYLGYVMREFLTYVNTAPTQTPVPTAVPAPAATPVPTQPAATSAPQRGSYARVTTQKGSLNLRVEKGGKVLRTIPQYEMVEVLEKGAEWCMVRYAGVTGYAMTKFLTFISVAPSPTNPPVLYTATPAPSASGVQTATVKTEKGSLNLRAIPDGKVLRTVPQYAAVNVISRGTSWTKVSYQGITGYVMTKFLSFNTVQPAPTQVPAATQPPQVTPIPEQSGQQVICYAIVMTPRGSLNLRKYADSDAKVLLTIPQYTQIPVHQKGSAWSLVSYKGETGYVMNSFLSFSNPTVPTAAPVPEYTQMPPSVATATPPAQSEQNPYIDPTLVQLNNVVLARVNTDGSFLNLREYCSTDAAVLKEIPQGTYVVITKVGSDWCEVIHEDKKGYCLEKYLEYTP